MVDSGVRGRPDLSLHRDGAVRDLIVSKLRHPPVRPGTIRRSALIERLARDDSRPIVSVVAAPGYGKTTLLSQWAEYGDRAFAWVSVDEQDNDPKVLLRYVAEALDTVQPVSARVFEALASPVSSVPGSVVPRLGSAFASMTVPVVLVLDDVHALHNSECRAALSVLADHVPGGSRLVLAGRDQPPLRVARLRAEGRILEIGPADLSLTPENAAALLSAAGVVLAADEAAVLHQRTEGWPVGLYLAALYLRQGGSLGHVAVAFGGDDRLVSEYMESELLTRVPRWHRAFLTRTAVLERMSGPLCEAVLELPGSAATLAELAQSNLLLVPLDRRDRWYRYHHLFRDMLLAELERREPGLSSLLRRRAAAWCLRNDLPEEALEYSIAAGDVEVAARLVGQLGMPMIRQGRAATLRRWFGWLEDRGAVEGQPMVAVLATTLSAELGRPVEAERWADAIERWEYQDAARPKDPAVEAWAAVIRAILCRHGIEQMRADADEAARRFAAAGMAAAVIPLARGIAQVLSGDLDHGDASFEETLSHKKEVRAPDVLVIALCERSLVAMARHEWDRARILAGQADAALRRAGLAESYVTPLVCAVQARAALHEGDVPAACQQLIRAQRLRPLLTYAYPHIAIQARIALTRAHLALSDPAGARALMREIDELLKQRPDVGTLAGEVRALRTQLSEERGPSVPGPSSLTAAELRILPLLATHLSFPEIAAELYLSKNTIKSQAYSLYRKLGAASRSQAVTRSRELALLDG
jgi:LuxR family transcriptional regulator, maltose regulon positive regulatory protein